MDRAHERTPTLRPRTPMHVGAVAALCGALMLLGACAREAPANRPAAAAAVSHRAPRLAFAEPAGGALTLRSGSSMVLVFDQPIDPGSTAGIHLRAGSETVALDVRTVGNAVQLIARRGASGPIDLTVEGLRSHEHGTVAEPLRLSYVPPQAAAVPGTVVDAAAMPLLNAAAAPAQPVPQAAPRRVPGPLPDGAWTAAPQDKPAPLQAAL